MTPSIEGLPEMGWLSRRRVRAGLCHRGRSPPRWTGSTRRWRRRRSSRSSMRPMRASIRVAEKLGFATREEARYRDEPILLFRRRAPLSARHCSRGEAAAWRGRCRRSEPTSAGRGIDRRQIEPLALLVRVSAARGSRSAGRASAPPSGWATAAVRERPGTADGQTEQNLHAKRLLTGYGSDLERRYVRAKRKREALASASTVSHQLFVSTLRTRRSR